jgi:hypothetical protein
MKEGRGLKFKRTILFRPPAERLLLSIIDANPDVGADINSAKWRRRREVRVKKAMKKLFGSDVNVQGEQPFSDQRALYWMASGRHQDRFKQQLLSGKHPFARSESVTNYTSKIPKGFKPRSDRKLASEAADKFYGPFEGASRDAHKQTHVERLRKKWMVQKHEWRDDLFFNDNIDDSMEQNILQRCWDTLEELGITTIANDLSGKPAQR